jgi:hypothetical protein
LTSSIGWGYTRHHTLGGSAASASSDPLNRRLTRTKDSHGTSFDRLIRQAREELKGVARSPDDRPCDPPTLHSPRVGHGPDHRRLTAELEAAGAEAERLREQEAAVENWAELSDVEQATFERLSELRRVIAGEAEGRSTRSGRLLGESLSSLFYIVRIRARRRNGCMLNWRWSAIAAS